VIDLDNLNDKYLDCNFENESLCNWFEDSLRFKMNWRFDAYKKDLICFDKDCNSFINLDVLPNETNEILAILTTRRIKAKIETKACFK
jgi:hypothetical protein